MSTPQDRAGRQQAEGDSHAAVHQGIQALAGAAAKMGSAKMEPHPELMAALQSLHGGIQDLHSRLDAGENEAAEGQQPDYSNMPDPEEWVEDDPQGAASYAEAILQRFAEMLVNQAAAPQGEPQMQAGPNVGGGASY